MENDWHSVLTCKSPHLAHERRIGGNVYHRGFPGLTLGIPAWARGLGTADPTPCSDRIVLEHELAHSPEPAALEETFGKVDKSGVRVRPPPPDDGKKDDEAARVPILRLDKLVRGPATVGHQDDPPYARLVHELDDSVGVEARGKMIVNVEEDDSARLLANPGRSRGRA